MTGRHRTAGFCILAAAVLASACTSRDDTAAAAAAEASGAFDAGQIAVAQRAIGRALAARDDVSEYWLLSAHIALAAQDYGGAYEAYENVITLDRSNVEALTRLCQIALSADNPERAERYAGQLLLLRPGDKAALTLQASLALKRGDKPGAARLLDQALAGNATDPLALVVKSKLLQAEGNYVEAARAAEASLASPGDLAGRLTLLRDLYLKAKNRDGYARTLARLAQAYPDTASAQLAHAASLYDGGDARGALAVTERLLARRRDDVGTAGAVLDLWLAQGTAAMPAGAIASAASGKSLPAKAAHAQYASEIGRPDIALAILGDAAANDPPTTLNADAKVARSYARALRGATAQAATEISGVLAADSDQPRALLARGRMRAEAGDRRGAIEDVRHALAGDDANASARLVLADLQLADGDAVLAVSTLRDGATDPGDDPRVVMRLTLLLRSQGHADEATAALADYVRANPFSQLARR